MTLEDLLYQQLTFAGLTIGVEREYRFHPTRRWRFDFAWEYGKLACEVEGAVYAGGRHTRGAGFEGDCEKYNEALLLGWRVLRVTGKHIESGQALQWIERAIGC